MIYCAEVGSSHKGKKALAYELIRKSALAGADIVKFQLGHYHPNEHLEEVTDITRQLIRWSPMEWVEDLATWCEMWGVEFMASIFGMEGLKAARNVGMRRYKMASFRAFKEHSFDKYFDLLEEMKRDGKEIFATGTADTAYEKLHPIFGIANYPTFPERYKQPPFYSDAPNWYGYSSHIHGIGDALIAISRGARYVEKHVTLDKTDTAIKDNHFAISFDEFETMVDVGREIEALCSVS